MLPSLPPLWVTRSSYQLSTDVGHIPRGHSTARTKELGCSDYLLATGPGLSPVILILWFTDLGKVCARSQRVEKVLSAVTPLIADSQAWVFWSVRMYMNEFSWQPAHTALDLSLNTRSGTTHLKHIVSYAKLPRLQSFACPTGCEWPARIASAQA